MTAPFEVVAQAGARIAVVAHVPHASTRLPPEVRAELLVDDAELEQELLRLTDWYSDDLFAPLGEHGATLFVNRLSRLVFDPERFVDPELEPAEQMGQGVLYTHGSQGQRLRELDPDLRAQRIETLYRPYHAALDELVSGVLDEFGGCTVIDCHSFPSVPLPSELDQRPGRPDICIGTDATHTPPQLAEAMERAFAGEGFSVKRDMPFRGTFVPGRFYGKDARVRSVMIEVRRGLYMSEGSGRRSPDYGAVKAALERAVASSGVLTTHQAC